MNSGNPHTCKQAHLQAWLDTTRHYLFSDQAGLADAAGATLPEPSLVSHGAQDRFISRARGRLLRLMKQPAQRDRNPLLELERTFHRQAAFIARHPDVPRRLLGWMTQGSDSRIQRRIRKVIGHYESRISRLIARARQQGYVKADIDPHAAAGVFIGMIQNLALRLNLNQCQRERLLREAFDHFSLFRTGLAAASR